MTVKDCSPKCPQCGSAKISDDGDLVENLTNPDVAPAKAVYYAWWHCDDCEHDWRYQDDNLNPSTDNIT